jgi:hypothetical protein
MGKKAAGGNFVSGECPYIEYIFMIKECYPPNENKDLSLYSICSILRSNYSEYYLEALRIWLGK